MSSTPPPQIPCDVCCEPTRIKNAYEMTCGCPCGAIVCHRCRSIFGNISKSVMWNHCKICSERFPNAFPDSRKFYCIHSVSQTCRHCGILQFMSSSLQCSLIAMRLAWEKLRANNGLVSRNTIFAMMAQNWGMFSHFCSQSFCIHLMENPWTEAKKRAFFQLWLLSQMNYPIGPCRMIQIHTHLWQTYPHSPLHISSQFSWRFRRFPWVRKLISRFAMLFESSRCDALQLFRHSYLHRCRCTKHRFMLYIIRYLMSQHAEIFELTM